MAEEAGAGRLGVEVVGCGPARKRVTEQVPQVFVLKPEQGDMPWHMGDQKTLTDSGRSPLWTQ